MENTHCENNVNRLDSANPNCVECSPQKEINIYQAVHIYIYNHITIIYQMGMGQNLVPLVNLKIAGKWMFITLKMVLIGIDP